MTDTTKRTLKTALWMGLIILVSFSVFIFFQSFFSHNLSSLATEILAAVLGAILVMLVTATLLRYQTSGEEQKEKSLGVFKHKLEIYSGFLDYVHTMISDGRITQNEVSNLIKWASKICLVAAPDVTLRIMEFVQFIRLFKKFRYDDLSEAEKQEWHTVLKSADPDDTDLDDPEYLGSYVTVGQITAALRDDLGEAIQSDEDANISTAIFVDEMVHGIAIAKQKKKQTG